MWMNSLGVRLMICNQIVSFCSGYPEEDAAECDTRYGFCALATLYLLKRLDIIDVLTAGEYILKVSAIYDACLPFFRKFLPAHI